MTDLSNISPKIQSKIEQIKAMAGDSKKIDNGAEYDALAKLLSGETGRYNKEYIKDLMEEYENNYPTTEKYKEQQAEKKMMEGVSQNAKKQVAKLISAYDKKAKKYEPSDLEKYTLVELYNNELSGLSKDEKQYLKKLLEARGISTEKCEIKHPDFSDEQKKQIHEMAKKVRDGLEGYTTGSEQNTIYNVIMKYVNSENILEFLSGYNSNGFNEGEGIFEQLTKELNFEKKGEIIDKLKQDLKNYINKYRQSADGQYHNAAKGSESDKYNVLDTMFEFGSTGSGVYDARRADKFVEQEVKLLHGWQTNHDMILNQ